MTSHKTLIRVRIEFVMEIPGDEVPSATREAIDAAALAISGPPFHVLPGASVTVDPYDGLGDWARVRGSGRGERTR